MATPDPSLSSSSSSAPPSLTTYIASTLESTFPGTHDFKFQTIRSQPRRSYALFPHHSLINQNQNQNHHKTGIKIWQEEVLCVLSIEREVTTQQSEGGAEGNGKGKEKGKELNETTTTTQGDTQKEKEKETVTTVKGWVPLCAIEASIYTIPLTSVSILYISKIDTTGLQPPPSSSSLSPTLSPTKAFVAAFLRYHFDHPPHGTKRLRVHVFARSQSQYLFPGSIENTSQTQGGKKVLDDKGLLRWWKSTLELSTTSSSSKRSIQKFYLIPGLTLSESLPYLPSLPSSSWVYGHPYSTLSSPLHPPSTPASTLDLADLIPAFPDDPKSRFLHSLTSSSLSPSGAEGDYDDLHHQLHELSFISGSNSNSTLQSRMKELEKERERERGRLVEGVKGGVGEWWERMGWRQECCSGVLVGFFVLALGDDEESTDHETTTNVQQGGGGGGSGGSTTAPTGYPSSLPHAIFTKLWTQFHNQDYSLLRLSSLIPALSKWADDVERLVGLEVEKGNVEKGEIERLVKVRNEGLMEALREERKRKMKEEEGKRKVNTLAPRKKKKV
ncbi:H3 histone acetyltransferase RTT109 [Sporobolomyces salmoneus]|uniref:H3 histone acetyltransferase RTT109 n=1 Tax=Sporobolomyces salmoneus TaxID=183962 RepID=UPI00316C249C